VSLYLVLFVFLISLLLRGSILLCIPPTIDEDAIRAVKWNPKDPDTLAIASDNKIFVIDLASTQDSQGSPLPHSELYQLGVVFNVPSVCTLSL